MKRTSSWIGSAVLLLAATTAAPAATISFAPPTQTVGVGSSAVVDVIISGAYVGAFDLDVTYDPSIVSFREVVFGDFLGAPFSLQDSAGGGGVVDLAEVSLLDPAELMQIQPASFRLASIIFDAVGVGVSPLAFSQLLVGDPEALSVMLDSQAGEIRVTGGGEPLVPEPSTISMFILAGGVLALLRRRRKLIHD